MPRQLSNDENCFNGNSGWKYLIIQTFVKSGPWAVLLVIVLGAIWYELDKWGGEYIRAQQRYIAQSTENIVTLQRATQLLTETVTRNTGAFADIASDVRHSQEMIVIQTTLIAKANEMMKDAPERTKKTLAVLERIETVLSQIEGNGFKKDG